MSFGDGPLNDLRLPLRWTVTAAVAAAVLISLALLLTDRRERMEGEGYNGARSAFDTAAGPVAGTLSAPVRVGGDVVDAARDRFHPFEDISGLRRQAAEGRQWRDAAVALREQNAQLSALLRLRIEPATPSVAARAVLDARGPFSQSRLIDAGRGEGVRVGNPVMSAHGLVGRVIGVARGISRVVMVTDPISRVPVMIDRTDARAILSGDGGDTPRLEYLRGQSPVRAGDRVMTSGDGGLFPRGLPVGVVVRASDGAWRVRLFSERASISYVRVLLYQDFANLASQPELSAPTPLSALPPPPQSAAPATPPPAGAQPVPATPAAPAR